MVSIYPQNMHSIGVCSMQIDVKKELRRVRREYREKAQKGDSYAKGVAKGKLLEELVRLYLREKGLDVSGIAGATHGIPDVAIRAKEIVLSHSTLYLAEDVIECCNLSSGANSYYRMPYMKNLYERLDSYFKENKRVYLIYSYPKIFKGEFKNLQDLQEQRVQADWEGYGDFFLIELDFDVAYENLNIKTYNKLKRILDEHF